MSVMHFRIKILPFMTYSAPVHRIIIYTGLGDITPMFLSIDMVVHFFFNSWMEFKEQNQMGKNGIYSLMQLSIFLNIRKAQFTMLSTSKYSMIKQYHILNFPLIMFSIILTTRQNFLN